MRRREFLKLSPAIPAVLSAPFVSKPVKASEKPQENFLATLFNELEKTQKFPQEQIAILKKIKLEIKPKTTYKEFKEKFYPQTVKLLHPYLQIIITPKMFWSDSKKTGPTTERISGLDYLNWGEHLQQVSAWVVAAASFLGREKSSHFSAKSLAIANNIAFHFPELFSRPPQNPISLLRGNNQTREPLELIIKKIEIIMQTLLEKVSTQNLLSRTQVLVLTGKHNATIDGQPENIFWRSAAQNELSRHQKNTGAKINYLTDQNTFFGPISQKEVLDKIASAIKNADNNFSLLLNCHHHTEFGLEIAETADGKKIYLTPTQLAEMFAHTKAENITINFGSCDSSFIFKFYKIWSQDKILFSKKPPLVTCECEQFTQAFMDKEQPFSSPYLYNVLSDKNVKTFLGKTQTETMQEFSKPTLWVPSYNTSIGKWQVWQVY